MKHLLTLSVCLALLLSTNLQANDIFIALGDGSNSMEHNGGVQSGTLNVYISDQFGDIDTGAGISATPSNTAVLQVTGANTLNFEILVAGMPFMGGTNRWQNVADGTRVDANGEPEFFPPAMPGDAPIPNPAYDGNPVQVDSFNGISVNEGTGILQSQTSGMLFEDQGHDGALGAFLFATIDYTADFTGVSEDITIDLSTGSQLVVNEGGEVFPRYASFTFTAPANAIPEPGSAAVLALGMVALIGRRRR